ncbi:MAG: phage major capsid protein, partial [Acidimicrobiia bacterium]
MPLPPGAEAAARHSRSQGPHRRPGQCAAPVPKDFIMRTAEAVKAEIKEVASRSTALLKNKRLSNAQKSNQMDQIELKLGALQAELADVESVGAKVKAMNAAIGRAEAYDEGLGGGSVGLAAYMGEPMVNAAPSLRLGFDEAKALQNASLERRSLAVKVGANITESTMGPTTLPTTSWPAVGIPREPQRILDLIPLLPAPETGVVRYYVVSGTTAAAATAEGNVKPLSDVAFTPTDASIRKIAHRMVASQEVIEDFVGFTQYVQMEMQAGLVDAESDEILNGSGTSPHIKGLLNSPGIGTVTANGGEAALTTLQRGITSLRSSGRFCEP